MRISTGIDSLDRILDGGFLSGRAYLVHGPPGAGKTILGMHFLSSQGGGLLVALVEPGVQILADASSLGLNIGGVQAVDLTPAPELFSDVHTYDVFSPAEVEREPVSRRIAGAIEESNPKRIFVDGFEQFQNLGVDAFHRRRLAQSFFRFATARGATLLISSGDCECASDADGVIELQHSGVARSLCVTKLRGSDFRAGSHAMILTGRGIELQKQPAQGD